MARLAVYLFGVPRYELDGVPLALDHHKPVALLTYLVLTGQVQMRDGLAAIFWPEDQQARTFLRNNLYIIRKALGQVGARWLYTDRDTAMFQPDADVWVDVTAFRQGLTACPTASHLAHELCSVCLPRLEEAVSLYQADFLAGFTLRSCSAFDEWQFFQSERLRHELVSGLQRLLTAYTQQHAWDAAIPIVQRWLALDPLHEPAHRHLIQLYLYADRPSAALRQYQECVRILNQELRLGPELETQALYYAIKDRQPLLLPPRIEVTQSPSLTIPGQVMPSPAILLTAPSDPPHNLPASLNPLLGRTAEQVRLQTMLRDPAVRLVTLTGPGGVGKTRLALQVATELLDTITDGVYFVALASLSDPTLVLVTIAQTLAIREIGGCPLLDTVKQQLRTKQLLLVLDNFEHLLPTAALVGELLRTCPDLKVLVTSRTPLHLYGEHEFVVQPLPVPSLPSTTAQALATFASVQLFLQRARAVKATFTLNAENIHTVADICVRLDGLPLAIELAAARIKLFTPHMLWQQLTQPDGPSPLYFLKNSVIDAPERHRSLWDLIGWSYHLLTVAEQALFRRLAVFVGGCTMTAAETVMQSVDNFDLTGLAVTSTFDLLASLVDKNLIYLHEQTTSASKPLRSEARFLLLETIRAYGLERLQETGELAHAQRQHAEYYLALVEAAAPHLQDMDQDVWLERLTVEHDNLRAVLDWVMRNNEAAFGLHLGNLLAVFWLRRNHHREGLQRLLQLIDLPDNQQPSSLLATVFSSIAILYSYGDDPVQERLFCERSLLIAQQIGDQQRMAYALAFLGDFAYGEGDYVKADALYEEAMALHRIVGDAKGLATMLSHRGDKLAQRGIFLNARALAEEGLALQKQQGDKWLLGISLRCLGNVCRLEGDYATATKLFRETLAVAQALHHKAGIAFAQFFLGALALEEHRSQAALDWLRQSLATMHEIGYRARHGDVLDLLARVALAQNQPARALQIAGAAATFRLAKKWRLPPVYQAHFDQMRLAARQELSEEAADTAWTAGQGLTLDDAVVYALTVPATGK